MDTVLVTGASAGFGAAIARRFGAQGKRQILVARRVARLDALRQELSADRTLAIGLDVRDRTAVAQTIGDLPAAWKDVDCLVNNAGLAVGLSPAWQADLDDWETMVDTNIKGLTYLTRAILPNMIERGQGHIVNIGSIAGAWPYPGGNAYGATKAFVAQFSRNLRADLHGTGVRVTNIEPGLAQTEFSVVRFKGDQEKAAAVYQGTIPLYAEDIAECVVWATAQPAHVNINSIEVMPTAQSWAALAVARK